jgi:hypothetical protein
MSPLVPEAFIRGHPLLFLLAQAVLSCFPRKSRQELSPFSLLHVPASESGDADTKSRGISSEQMPFIRHEKQEASGCPVFRSASRSDYWGSWFSNRSWSPGSVLARMRAPGGSSRAMRAPGPPRRRRKGGTDMNTLSTLPFRSRKATSIGKRMKNVWTEEQGTMRRPSPSGR